LAQILIEAVGVDVEPQFNPRDVLVSRRAADISQAREVLGWVPEISVEQGMTQLVRAGG
jgi:UDP-glucose 4-epimerase